MAYALKKCHTAFTKPSFTKLYVFINQQVIVYYTVGRRDTIYLADRITNNFGPRLFPFTNHFRPYLFGVKFQLITDHTPLVWLLNLKDPNSKLSRWRLKLSEYNFDIKHIPGKSNKVAELSRVQINQIAVRDYLTFLSTKKDIPLINFDYSNEQVLDSNNKNIIYIYDESQKNETHEN